MNPDLSLPSPFRLKIMQEAADAFQVAQASATAREGAGTLIWARRFHLADFAVVLEPEQPLGEARLGFYAAMNALAGALSPYCPPEKPLQFDWPDTIKVDGSIIGGGRLAWPAKIAETETPSWMVFGAKLRLAARPGEELGFWLRGTSLEDEGFEGMEIEELIESFSRHLMSALHEYEEMGVRHEIERWLQRLDRHDLHGVVITGNGDFIVRQGEHSDTRNFIGALAQPSWLDPQTGDPWL